MNSYQLISWLRWADAGDTDEEKTIRAARVKQHVFPETLDEEELARRESVFDHVQKMGEPPSWEGWPEPCEVPDAGVTTVPRVKVQKIAPSTWEGLVSPSSKAYKRASKHDGTAAQTDRMRDLAKGSPFDADEDVVEKKPAARPARPWQRR